MGETTIGSAFTGETCLGISYVLVSSIGAGGSYTGLGGASLEIPFSLNSASGRHVHFKFSLFDLISPPVNTTETPIPILLPHGAISNSFSPISYCLPRLSIPYIEILTVFSWNNPVSLTKKNFDFVWNIVLSTTLFSPG